MTIKILDDIIETYFECEFEKLCSKGDEYCIEILDYLTMLEMKYDNQD